MRIYFDKYQIKLKYHFYETFEWWVNEGIHGYRIEKREEFIIKRKRDEDDEMREFV